jgi:hypothetical protein
MVPVLADVFAKDFGDEYPEVELEIFAEDRWSTSSRRSLTPVSGFASSSTPT